MTTGCNKAVCCGGKCRLESKEAGMTNTLKVDGTMVTTTRFVLNESGQKTPYDKHVTTDDPGSRTGRTTVHSVFIGGEWVVDLL